jgi:hypothetical protein
MKPLRSSAILVAYSLFPKGILASGANVASPADAIKYLKPINLVIRPISLHTITLEHRIQADKQLPLQTICHIYYGYHAAIMTVHFSFSTVEM